MHRTVLFLAALAVCASAQAESLRPATASYDVSRGGKVIGEATLRLSDDGHDAYSFVSETHGTAGMARMVGLDVREESHFRWRDGRAESLSYDYKQDAAIKHKQRHIDFDWNAGKAHVLDGDKDFRYAIAPGTIDRHVATVALGQALADGAKDVALTVAVKDHTEDQHYAMGGEESLKLSGGTTRAVLIERSDGSGKIKSWFKVGDALPVRVEQAQKDGETIVMEIKSAHGR